MTDWAVSIPLDQVAAAAPLRLQADVDACVDRERLWLRGTEWNDSVDRSLRKILGAERFHVIPDGQTASWECTVPSGNVPIGPWTTFSEWLTPAAPATVIPAKIARRASLRLVRTSAERAANLMVAPFEVWRDYALEAPQVRLSKLSFAVSDDQLALVCGEPLPPLPGSRYVEADGVAVPLGWTWSPAVDARVLREVLGLADGDVALMAISGDCEIVRADDFVRATRSAVRLTEEDLRRET